MHLTRINSLDRYGNVKCSVTHNLYSKNKTKIQRQNTHRGLFLRRFHTGKDLNRLLYHCLIFCDAFCRFFHPKHPMSFTCFLLLCVQRLLRDQDSSQRLWLSRIAKRYATAVSGQQSMDNQFEGCYCKPF